MKRRELIDLGIPRSLVKIAQQTLRAAAQSGLKKREIRESFSTFMGTENKHHFAEDPLFGGLAEALIHFEGATFQERKKPAPWRSFAKDLEASAVTQMKNACRLPVAVRGALMPDAHTGYGLPIGGVLATENAVIPYAVGVDIACRMRLTVLDMPAGALAGQKDRLCKVLEGETRFGMGAHFKNPHDHEVLDDDWRSGPVTRGLLERARSQLGSSGSGNHFVEFGELTLTEEQEGLKPGTYLALLSHSGSRGPGARVANFYSRLAQSLHPELPKELRHLAWLDMDSEAGQDYWHAMNLMGRYAAANHEVIHRSVLKALRAKSLLSVENHHNFAWKEYHDGKEVIVHRKGATPAGKGVLGIIPGSMADPGYLVRGKGSMDSLESAAHGAGRVMSRRKARTSFRWSSVKKTLTERGVTLLSAGLDEVPGVYKDIDEVMDLQSDLIEVLARFDPKIVKMAPPGEPAED